MAGTIRTDNGQAPVNTNTEDAKAPQKEKFVNATTTTRTDAAGLSQGTTTQHTESSAYR